MRALNCIWPLVQVPAASHLGGLYKPLNECINIGIVPLVRSVEKVRQRGGFHAEEPVSSELFGQGYQKFLESGDVNA